MKTIAEDFTKFDEEVENKPSEQKADKLLDEYKQYMDDKSAGKLGISGFQGWIKDQKIGVSNKQIYDMRDDIQAGKKANIVKYLEDETFSSPESLVEAAKKIMNPQEKTKFIQKELAAEVMKHIIGGEIIPTRDRYESLEEYIDRLKSDVGTTDVAYKAKIKRIQDEKDGGAAQNAKKTMELRRLLMEGNDDIGKFKVKRKVKTVINDGTVDGVTTQTIVKEKLNREARSRRRALNRIIANLNVSKDTDGAMGYFINRTKRNFGGKITAAIKRSARQRLDKYFAGMDTKKVVEKFNKQKAKFLKPLTAGITNSIDVEKIEIINDRLNFLMNDYIDKRNNNLKRNIDLKYN